MTLLQSLFHATDFARPLLRGVAPGIAVIFALQGAAAVPSILARTERFYDLSGALTSISCVALSLYRNGAVGFNWRQVALSAAATVWATRLGSYLFRRILSEGKDSRFDDVRTKPGQFAIIWTAQAVWISCLLMPVLAVNAVPYAAFAGLPKVMATDVLGLAMFAGGLAIESVADAQKYQWKQEKDAKLHDEQFITRGLFSRSQFPHYFGEISLWTGIAIASAGVLLSRPVQLALGLSGGLAGAAVALGAVSVSPLFDWFVLTRLSGIPLSEKKYDRLYGDRQDYQEWKKNTPKLIPRLW